MVAVFAFEAMHLAAFYQLVLTITTWECDRTSLEGNQGSRSFLARLRFRFKNLYSLVIHSISFVASATAHDYGTVQKSLGIKNLRRIPLALGVSTQKSIRESLTYFGLMVLPSGVITS